MYKSIARNDSKHCENYRVPIPNPLIILDLQYSVNLSTSQYFDRLVFEELLNVKPPPIINTFRRACNHINFT